MSLWSRFTNVVRGDRLSRELDEEFAAHFEEAAKQGREPDEARRAFGSRLRQRENSQDVRLLPWLDSLRADAIFGWRQLKKKKITSAAAILSLALAIGACTSAFRLIDALLLRPLAIRDPGRLYVISHVDVDSHGKPTIWDSASYPMFRAMRAAVKNDAELIAISFVERTDLTYGSDPEMEKANRQFVSGSMFNSFGLHPAAGRLFTEADDLTPGGHAYAVLSYDYWTRRFARDTKVIGRTFRFDNQIYEIAGVAEEGFTGTETGFVTDIFVPTMMQVGSVNSPNSFWLRMFIQPKPGVALEPLRSRLYSSYRAFEQERSKGFINFPKEMLVDFPRDKLVLGPAAAGASNLQRDYRRALMALAVLVVLVLLIACANVANLMTAQAAARARELALRVSIGAGRWRLVQLVLVESAWLAMLAAALGALFAWQAAPFVVSRINPPDNPARLILPADWRVLGFGLALTFAVTFLLGLIPALRASAVKPASALKGGEDPLARRRMMPALIAIQVALCFVVHFVAGLFVASSDRLANRPTGFSSARILALETVAQHPQPPVHWEQVAEHLRGIAGVETVALAGWPLLSGTMSNNFIAVHGGPLSRDLAWFLSVSPGWIEAMQIKLLAGRDFGPSDTSPGAAIVNEAFVKLFFNGQNALGNSFQTAKWDPKRSSFHIVGIARDARYQDIREPIKPVAYVPFQSLNAKGEWQARRTATLIVRTSGPNPLAMAPILRREVPRARSEFRVSNIRTQDEINRSQTVRERLLAMLAAFFAAVALVLTGVGLFGVLDYSVLQRRREIGIRRAIGAQAGGIVSLVTLELFCMVLIGAMVGLALGLASVRYIESLLYQVKPTDIAALTLPPVAILVAALAAMIPAVIRAVRIDPVAMLRAD